MTIKKKLEVLTKQAKNSGESEFRYLVEFLNDQVESVDRGQASKPLLLAICDEFVETATYIKKELSKCQK
jgi:hypothetical protein